MMEDEDVIEEGSIGSARSSARAGICGESRWVDASEVGSESAPSWSVLGDSEAREQGFGMRRRLTRKLKRVNSFDVEAMEISGAHSSKVINSLQNCIIICSS